MKKIPSQNHCQSRRRRECIEAVVDGSTCGVGDNANLDLGRAVFDHRYWMFINAVEGVI